MPIKQTTILKIYSLEKNIRLTNDIIHESEVDEEVLIILLDFAKAFDFISWDFIDSASDLFSFCVDTRIWIHTRQNDSVSYTQKY